MRKSNTAAYASLRPCHYAKAENQTQHEKPIIQFGLPSKAPLDYI